MNIRLPYVNATTVEEQLSQIKSYLFQLVEQLNHEVPTEIHGVVEDIRTESNKPMTDKEKVDTFNELKALIIKSADIVSAYEDTMRKDFNGEYVAQSDYGTFVRNTNASIEANSTGIEQNYQHIQTITADVTILKETEAYIKTGLLTETPSPVYGVEVGQTDNGNFKRSARFTADRLSFYDGYDVEVAYISNKKLFINDAVLTGSVTIGKYIIDTLDGLAFRWIGE